MFGLMSSLNNVGNDKSMNFLTYLGNRSSRGQGSGGRSWKCRSKDCRSGDQIRARKSEERIVQPYV